MLLPVHETVEQLKTLIIETHLPRTEVTLCGITCPYCGKSDRIRQLEFPEDLMGVIDDGALARYTDLWRRLNPDSIRLGVCRFCLNPLALTGGAAESLDRW